MKRNAGLNVFFKLMTSKAEICHQEKATFQLNSCLKCSVYWHQHMPSAFDDLIDKSLLQLQHN